MILEVSWDGLYSLSFGPSQFHGQGYWLVCEVALSVQLLFHGVSKYSGMFWKAMQRDTYLDWTPDNPLLYFENPRRWVVLCNVHIQYERCSFKFRATSQTSQEPWPWYCENLKKMSKGHPKTPPKSCSAVTSLQVECEAEVTRQLWWISLHAWWSYMIKYNKPTFLRFQSVIIS